MASCRFRFNTADSGAVLIRSLNRWSSSMRSIQPVFIITDSLNPSGYLYTINPSRVPDVKVLFPVEKQSFKQARILSSKAVSFSDAAGQIYFVLIFSDRSR